MINLMAHVQRYSEYSPVIEDTVRVHMHPCNTSRYSQLTGLINKWEEQHG